MEPIAWVMVSVAVVGCTPAARVNGSALLVNMQPAAGPTLVGAYDFDLLGPVSNTACLKRSSVDSGRDTNVYWLVGAAFEKLPALDARVVANAVFNLIDKYPDLDSVVLTRVQVEAEKGDETCATVYGRGVRLKKANRKEPEESHDDEGDKPSPPVEPAKE